MHKGMRILAVLAVSLLPGLPQAAEQWEKDQIACIQNQLATLGISGVSPTGKINGATKAGTEAIRAQYPSAAGLALLPKLSGVSAVGWCREIAALQPALRRFMPSAQPPLVTGEGGQGSMQTRLLATAFRDVEQFFQSQYGIRPASRVDVAGAASGEVLTQLAVNLQRQRGRSIARMKDHVTDNCDSPSLRYGGQAYRNQLLLCWPVAKQYDKGWYSKVYPVVSSIMAHEYMHHVQRELANDKVSTGANRSQAKRGPAWMTEGTAELVEARWRRAKLGKGKSFAELQKAAHDHPKTLGGMHGWGSVKDVHQYRVAHFAAHLLAERYGDQAIMNYWRYIGQGQSWDGAFRAAFGESLSAFSSRFETLRHNTAQAKAYAAGQ